MTASIYLRPNPRQFSYQCTASMAAWAIYKILNRLQLGQGANFPYYTIKRDSLSEFVY
jgi:hypothetical protein